jgi:hypothetical protein
MRFEKNVRSKLSSPWVQNDEVRPLFAGGLRHSYYLMGGVLGDLSAVLTLQRPGEVSGIPLVRAQYPNREDAAMIPQAMGSRKEKMLQGRTGYNLEPQWNPTEDGFGSRFQ